jgi:hypothetical protein
MGKREIKVNVDLIMNNRGPTGLVTDASSGNIRPPSNHAKARIRSIGIILSDFTTKDLREVVCFKLSRKSVVLKPNITVGGTLRRWLECLAREIALANL